jgi:hypothetical protein
VEEQEEESTQDPGSKTEPGAPCAAVQIVGERGLLIRTARQVKTRTLEKTRVRHPKSSRCLRLRHPPGPLAESARKSQPQDPGSKTGPGPPCAAVQIVGERGLFIRTARQVKPRTLENHKGAAPKVVPALAPAPPATVSYKGMESGASIGAVIYTPATNL